MVKELSGMVGPMGSDDAKRDKKIVFWVTAEEEAAIERWRHERWISSRSEAVRQLIDLGLEADAKRSGDKEPR